MHCVNFYNKMHLDAYIYIYSYIWMSVLVYVFRPLE